VQFAGRPSISYDVLSIDIGITPGSEQVPGAREHTIPVKPIDRFVANFDAMLERYRAQDASTPLRVVIVGGGAGGAEIALSLHHRLEEERTSRGHHQLPPAEITLVCRGQLLTGHASYARRALIGIMKQKGIKIVEHCTVVRVDKGMLTVEAPRSGTHSQNGGSTQGKGEGHQLQQQLLQGNNNTVPFDVCMLCTQASAAPWLKLTGLPTDPQGFLAINECLQSEGGPPEVFAAGDVASCAKHPRPKAGVFAVRQGPPLSANLRRFLSGEPLEPFVPQSTWLSLITTGDKYCVGTKGWIGLQGAWLWSLKDYIDRAFMRKYGEDLPDMMKMMSGTGAKAQRPPGPPPVFGAAGPEALALLAESKMRCGGCGAKVGASVLAAALAQVHPRPISRPDVVMGLESPDDAALIRPPPPGKLLVQSVDFFRAFWDDPYILGKIAANHALGDVWAMGAKPVSALALAVVPLMADRLVTEELTQLMSGAIEVLNESGCALVGGHTCEGPELALGFSVTGEVAEAGVMSKGGLRSGQALVLTKPLGTGTLLAAAMQGKAKGRWVMGALSEMAKPSGKAADILASYGCTGCTDVTGFGLLGHLVEMTKPSQVHAELFMQSVPLLSGAQDTLTAGVTSSLHAQNARAAASVHNFDQVLQKHPQLWPILVDPQTGGGLLAGVAWEKAEACVQELRENGYGSAAIIGKVAQPGNAGSPILIS